MPVFTRMLSVARVVEHLQCPAVSRLFLPLHHCLSPHLQSSPLHEELRLQVLMRIPFEELRLQVLNKSAIRQVLLCTMLCAGLGVDPIQESSGADAVAGQAARMQPLRPRTPATETQMKKVVLERVRRGDRKHVTCASWGLGALLSLPGGARASHGARAPHAAGAWGVTVGNTHHMHDS